MNKDNKEFDNQENKLVKQDPAISAGKTLYRANSDDSKEDGDNNSESGFNERLRDLDIEMQQEAENQAREQEEQSSLHSEEDASYERDQERGFDPLTHQVETKKEAQQQQEEYEKEVDIDLEPHKKRGKKKRKFSFLSKLKLNAIAMAFKKTFKQLSSPSSSKMVEDLSSYRHYTINRPGNQAGIFDNTIEENKETARDTIIKAAAAKHFLGEGLQALEMAQEAASKAAHQAATPYEQQLQHAQEAVKVAGQAVNSVEKAGDILDQGVSNESLGSLEHDARAIGMNIAGKAGPSREM